MHPVRQHDSFIAVLPRRPSTSAVPLTFCQPRAFIPNSGVCKNKTVPIIYIEPNGEEKEVQAEIGKNLLDIAHDNNIELEGMYQAGSSH